MFERAYSISAISDFRQRINDNMMRLERETRMSEFAVPVCILLLLDQANGGNAVGEEIVRRFNLIDVESRNVIDFYFMGWSRGKSEPFALEFDLSAFQACRQALSKVGVESFGGYADLLLFDAWLRSGRVSLDFSHALHIDLADALASKKSTAQGAFSRGCCKPPKASAMTRALTRAPSFASVTSWAWQLRNGRSSILYSTSGEKSLAEVP